jgi:hypothetical protein
LFIHFHCFSALYHLLCVFDHFHDVLFCVFFCKLVSL